MNKAEKVKSDEALVEKLREDDTSYPVGRDVQPNLGVLRFRDRDGKIHTFRGNRAERRRFIRKNKLVKRGK